MAQSCRATSWLIVSCGGGGSRAPWRSWDDGGRHGRWVRGLASFHLGTSMQPKNTPKTDPKPTTVGPHISVNNRPIGMVQMTVLFAYMVGRRLCRRTTYFLCLGVGSACEA